MLFPSRLKQQEHVHTNIYINNTKKFEEWSQCLLFKFILYFVVVNGVVWLNWISQNKSFGKKSLRSSTTNKKNLNIIMVIFHCLVNSLYWIMLRNKKNVFLIAYRWNCSFDRVLYFLTALIIVHMLNLSYICFAWYRSDLSFKNCTNFSNDLKTIDNFLKHSFHWFKFALKFHVNFFFRPVILPKSSTWKKHCINFF